MIRFFLYLLIFLMILFTYFPGLMGLSDIGQLYELNIQSIIYIFGPFLLLIIVSIDIALGINRSKEEGR